MILIPKKITLLGTLFFLLNLVIVVYLLRFGPRIGGDTPSYIGGEAFRPPVYVILLSAYQWLLGDNFYPLIIFQITLGLCGVYTLARTFTEILSLDRLISKLVFLILFIPYFFGAYKFGNSIQTEAITYPLYLMGFSFILKGLYYRSIKSFYIFLGILYVLVLTRTQLLFVYPAFFLIIVYCYFLSNFSIKEKVTVTLLFILVVVGANISERTYNLFKAGHFKTAPHAGIQLAVGPLYMSTEKDNELFDDPIEREIFVKARKKLEDNHSLYESTLIDETMVSHYAWHHGGCYVFTAHKALEPSFEEIGISDWFEIDRIAKKIAIKLILEHPVENLKLFFHKVKFQLGGYYFFLLFSLLFIYSGYIYIRKQDALSLIIFLSLLFTFSNYFVVAAIEVFLRRYTSYTETILFSALTILLYLLLPKFKKSN